MPDFSDFFDSMGVTVAPSDRPSGVSLFLHGLAGAGKTSLAVTSSLVPEMCPVLVLDVEGRTGMALKDWGDSSQVTVVNIDSWPTLAKVRKRLEQAAKTPDGIPFKTVIIDSSDRLQKKILDHFGALDTAKANPFQKWAEVYQRLQALLDFLIPLPGMNVICITHSSRDTDAVTGTVLISPAFEGQKSLAEIPSMFDLVGYQYWDAGSAEDQKTGGDSGNAGDGKTGGDSDEMVPVVVFRAPGVLAKKGSRHVPDLIRNPTMEVIYRTAMQTRDQVDGDSDA